MLLLFTLCAVTMSACAVKGCNNSYRKRIIIEGKPVKYFRFPKDDAIAAKWREVCKNGVNTTYGRICSKHFDTLCYEKPAQQITLQYSPLRGRKLRLDAIPTLHLFEESHVVQEFDACVEDAPKMTAKSQPATLDNIAGDAIITTAAVDYPTIVKNLQLELTKTKEALMQSEKKIENQIKEKVEKNMYKILKQVFTPGQIKILLNPQKKRVVWSSEDIASAISLRSVSPKAYRYLQNVVKIPLPGLSTIRRCTAFVETAKESLPR